MFRALPLSIVLLLLAGSARADDAVDAALAKMKDKKQETRLAGIAAAAELQDAKITSQLIKFLKDKDWHVRQLSIEVLSNRTGDGDRKKAALALATRLKALRKSVSTADEYTQTIAALGSLARKETAKALIDMDVDEGRDTAQARLMAAANAPYAETVDELIKFLSKGRNKGRGNQRQLTLMALRHITGVNVGSDPDKWRSWWKENRATWSLKAVKDERLEKKRAAEEKAKEQAAKKAEREKKRRENQEKKGKKKRDAERDGPPD